MELTESSVRYLAEKVCGYYQDLLQRRGRLTLGKPFGPASDNERCHQEYGGN